MIQKPPTTTGSAGSLLSPQMAQVPDSALPLGPSAASGYVWSLCPALPHCPRAVPIPPGRDGPSSPVSAPNFPQVPLCSQAAPRALMAAPLPSYSHQPQPSLRAAVPAPLYLSVPLLRSCARTTSPGMACQDSACCPPHSPLRRRDGLARCILLSFIAVQ